MTDDEKRPRVGELVYGCQHRLDSACGCVESVSEHVTDDGMDHWLVTEDWHGRTIRAKRERNGLLYEVEVRLGHD